MIVEIYPNPSSRIIFFILLVFFYSNAFNQNLEGAYWYWGNNLGLEFLPKPEFDSNNVLGGSFGRTTISDKNGNLLLYSNFLEIRNGKHNIVINSQSPVSQVNSSGQALITKLPKSDSLYLLAQVNRPVGGGANQISANLYYSIIDITAENDTGRVLNNHHYNFVEDSLANKLAILKHANEKDFWIVCLKNDGNTFYSYLLDETGLDTANPVITQVGRPYNPFLLFDGSMKSSPDSEKLALVKNQGNTMDTGWIELFQFDRQNGVPSNPIEIDLTRTFSNILDCAFAPNSDILIVPFKDGSQTPDTSFLNAYNLQVWDSADINNSKSTIHFDVMNNIQNVTSIGLLQLAIDGNIYFVNSVGSHQHIGRLKCVNDYNNVIYDTLFIRNLPSGRQLPTLNQTLFVNANILQAQSQSGDVCLGDTAQLIAYGAGADRFIWSLEDGSPAGNLSDDTLPNPRAWPDTTTYRVIGISSSCTSADGEDTAFVTVRVGQGPDEPLFPDSVSRCVNDTFNAELPAATPFWWSTGTDSNGVALTQSDTYRYVYADSLGCASDTFSFTLNFFDSAVVELDADSQLCVFEEGQANVISQTAVNWTAAAQVVESDSFFIRYRADSSFWLRAVPQDSNACAVSDSVFVTVIPTPNAGDDFDTVMCLPDSFSFIPNAPQLQNLRFVRESTGDTLQPQDFPKRLFLNDILNETFIAVNPENCSDTVHVSAEVLIPETEPEGRYEMRRDCDETVLRIFPQSGIEWYLNGNRIGVEDLPVTVGDSFLIAEYDQSRRCLNTSRLIIGEGSAKLAVELPNVFTPNNDGVNDLFEPVGAINHVCGTLQVYNRWGNLIYENREGAGISWDGRNTSGKPVPVGTYFYVYTSGNEVVKGSVQVLR